jgi:hypothetical protein
MGQQPQLHKGVCLPKRFEPWQQPANCKSPDNADRQHFVKMPALELLKHALDAAECVG